MTLAINLSRFRIWDIRAQMTIANSGVRDFEHYRVDPTVSLMSDFFVPDDDVPPPGVGVQALPSVGAAKPR